MFRRKRLAKVIITLKHGGYEGREILDKPVIVEDITILPGQSFHCHIGYYEVREHGEPVRTISPRAGYTEDIEYFYQ